MYLKFHTFPLHVAVAVGWLVCWECLQESLIIVVDVRDAMSEAQLDEITTT